MTRTRKLAAAAAAAGAVLGAVVVAAPAQAQVITVCPATISSFTFAGGRGGGAVGQGLHGMTQTATRCNYTADSYIVSVPGQGNTTTHNVKVQITKNFVYPVVT